MRFNEITKGAIKEAFDTPGDLDQGLINAQETRRILDRIFGYGLSGILWKKIGSYGKLSAGRVQSVAVRLVVEREKEINSFPEEYWEIEIAVRHDEREVNFKLNTKKSNLEIKSAKEANDLAESLQDTEIEIFENENKKKDPSKAAIYYFNTATNFKLISWI